MNPDGPGVTRAERAAWATAIADELIVVRQARANEGHFSPLPIDECWVGEDLALYIRYRGGARWLATRVPDLHVSVLCPEWPPGSVGGQASDIFDDLYGAVPTAYTDRLGYDWFGWDPEDWEWAVHEQPRLYTAWPPPTEPAAWASEVAAALVELAAEERAVHPHDPHLAECWVGEDLALYARYSYRGAKRGHRTDRLGPEHMRPEFVRSPRNCALEVWHEFGDDSGPAYVDSAGHGWGGDPPQAPVTWAYVVERMPRVLTVGVAPEG